jgi:hypothetical protein
MEMKEIVLMFTLVVELLKIAMRERMGGKAEINPCAMTL